MMGLMSHKNHNICKIQQWILCFWQIKRLFSKKQHLVFLYQRLKIMGLSCAKFLETTTIAHVQCICVLCAHFLARSVFILSQAAQQKNVPKDFFEILRNFLAFDVIIITVITIGHHYSIVIFHHHLHWHQWYHYYQDKGIIIIYIGNITITTIRIKVGVRAIRNPAGNSQTYPRGSPKDFHPHH